MHTVPATNTIPGQALHHAVALQAATQRLGFFPQALVPLLEQFTVRMAAQLDGLAGQLEINRDEILQQAALDMADLLSGLTLRSLVAEFHHFRTARGDRFATTTSTAWTAFEEATAQDGISQQLLLSNPVLERLVHSSIDFRVQLLIETLQHLTEGQHALHAADLIPHGAVQRLRVSDGDLHNQGRTVVMVDIDTGTVVYKPRPVGCEQLALDVTELLNPGLRPDSQLRLPQVLQRHDHGWQEFITTAPAPDLAAAGRFAYRMGAFSVIFAALGTTDLHCGNVLACGEYPMFVDLETLTQLRSRIDQIEQMTHAPRLAMLETGLLPFQVDGTLVDVDISGIGRSDVQESRHQTMSLIDQGTDAVRLGTVPATVLQSDNLLHLAGQPLAIRELESDFDAGIQDALAAVRSQQEGLEDLIRSSRFQVRQVLHPTLRYAKMLDAATHPDYLALESERSRLMGRLPALSNLPEPMAQAVHELEVQSLERGDVPCFVVDSDSTTLRTRVDGQVADVFALTPIDDMIGVLKRFLATPDRQHRYLALASLAATVPTVATTAHDDAPQAGSHFASLLSRGATAVPEQVSALLTELSISETDPSWLMTQVTGRGRLGLAPATTSLYDGAGIALLLAHTDPALAARALSPHYLDTVAERDAPLGRSVFSGPASAAFVLDEMASTTGESSWAERRDAYLDTLLDSIATEQAPRDLIGGIGGVLAFLAQPGRSDLVVRHHDLMVRNLPELVTTLTEQRLPAHETAHGAAGVAWALARAAYALNDPAGLDLARRQLIATLRHWQQLSTSWPQIHDASWCKGHAGALLSTGEGLLLTGSSPNEVLAQIEPIADLALAASRGRGRDLSPCHGISGTVQVLTHLARLLHAPHLAEQATDLFVERLDRVAHIGFNGGLHRSQTSLSYMTGLTGVAHTALITTTALTVGAATAIPLALTTTIPTALIQGTHPEGGR